MAEHSFPQLELSQEVRQTIERVRALLLEHNFPLVKLILFGSHAKGQSHEHSDVDLCAVLKKGSNVRKYSVLAIKETGRAGLYVDVIVIDEKKFENDFVSPIVHEIRTHGILMQ